MAAPATEALWAVDYPDGQDRELTQAQIQRELAAGTISYSTLVWRDGMDEWLELGQVPELQSIAPPAKLAPAPAAPPAAPIRAKAPSAPGIDPPKPAELPKPRPPAQSVPVIDFGLREAINNPGAPPIPRAPTMSGIGRPPTPPTAQPFEVPAAGAPLPAAAAFPAAPTFPAAPVMVPAPAIAAAFAAPIQAFPRPNATPVGAISPTAGIPDWPEERKSKAPLVIGLIVLLLAIGGGAFAFISSSDDKLPPPVPISALPPTTPPATHPVEPAAPEPTPTPTPVPPSAGQAASGSRSALGPPGSSPTTTPNAGFAELFASGARTADDKTGSAGPAQRFDQNAAKAALANAAFETAKCRESGGPTGLATVVVTFEPSGKVASATVSNAPFAGTSSGACITAALKRATVPAFSGLPGTVTKIISIQ